MWTVLKMEIWIIPFKKFGMVTINISENAAFMIILDIFLKYTHTYTMEDNFNEKKEERFTVSLMKVMSSNSAIFLRCSLIIKLLKLRVVLLEMFCFFFLHILLI